MSDESTRAKRRKRAFLALRITGTLIAFLWVLSLAAPGELLEVALSLPGHVPPLVVATMAVGLAVGTVRWRVLLWAYGADELPSLARLYYLYLVAFFYNSFLPGGLGGDIVRGIVSRESFGDAGVTRSLTVVFVERVLGLAGLLVVTGTALVLHPLSGFASGPWLGVAGLAGAAAAIVAIAVGRRFASATPSFLGRRLEKLPPLERPMGIVGGIVLSLVTQFLAAVSGYWVLSAIDPSVSLADALVVVPIATAAAFFPLTVGGAGAREAAFVVLCSLVLAMDAPDAVTASLVLFASQLGLGALGGLLQLVIPLSRPEKS